MEKKVYKIRRWFDNSRFPEQPLKVIPRRGYDEECYAEDEFRALANKYLSDGCKIVRIVHIWNYRFVTPRGSGFSLYMYED